MISDVDPDIAAGFATTIVIGNGSAAPWRRKTSARRKTNVLHSVAERRVHHYRLKCRTWHVVFIEGAIQEWLFLLVVLQLDPRCFVLNILQAVRWIAIHGENVPRLRIKHHHRAVVTLQLINDGLLEIPIDGKRVVFVHSPFYSFAANDLPDFRHSATFNPEQRALQSRLTTIRSEEMGQRGVHGILAHDGTARIFFIVGERPPLPIVNPTAQSRFR